MGKSDYLAGAILAHEFGKATYVPPAHYFLCLTAIVPLPSQTGSSITEVTYGGYTRVQLDTADFSAVVAETLANLAAATFPTPASSDVARGWALCDASSGGNLLWFGTLAALAIVIGSPPMIPIAGLTFTES